MVFRLITPLRSAKDRYYSIFFINLLINMIQILGIVIMFFFHTDHNNILFRYLKLLKLYGVLESEIIKLFFKARTNPLSQGH